MDTYLTIYLTTFDLFMTKHPKIWIFVVIVWEEYRVLPDLGKS